MKNVRDRKTEYITVRLTKAKKKEFIELCKAQNKQHTKLIDKLITDFIRGVFDNDSISKNTNKAV